MLSNWAQIDRLLVTRKPRTHRSSPDAWPVSSSSCKQRSNITSGFTLIEIIIVIAVIAVAVSGIGIAFGAQKRSQIRSASVRILAASRYAYNRALTRGVTVRIRFDLDQDTFSIEEAASAVAIQKSAEEEDKDAWKRATAALDQDEQDPTTTGDAGTFFPISNRDGEPIKRYSSQKLGPSVKIDKIFVPHRPNSAVSGSESLYFFPGGFTEHALIQIADSEGQYPFTVEIHALTGKASIEAGRKEPRDSLLDPSEDGEVEDLS